MRKNNTCTEATCVTVLSKKDDDINRVRGRNAVWTNVKGLIS